MIRINLIPVKKSRRQETVLRELSLAGLGLVLVVVLLAVVYIFRAAQINDTRAANQDLERKIEEMKAIAAQVDEAEKLKADLELKLKTIKELKANKGGPVHLLDELAQAVPDKLQLTSLDEENGLVKLAGMAVSNEIISQFLSSLEQSRYFDDVFLVAIEQIITADGVKLKSFSVTLQLIVPGVDAVPAEGEGGTAPAGEQTPAPGQAG